MEETDNVWLFGSADLAGIQTLMNYQLFHRQSRNGLNLLIKRKYSSHISSSLKLQSLSYKKHTFMDVITLVLCPGGGDTFILFFKLKLGLGFSLVSFQIQICYCIWEIIQ
ncbi:uncharacterized protein [Narcine bancroftii]|uniref:uncharacterized protein isoform X2 n=1 Tax=Narcine bancroftii TaxID=1343680 RepID=UPI003831A2D8